MKLYTKNVNSNYLAKVVALGKVWTHPNADRLRLTSVDNQVVIVGSNAKEGDIYVYFPLECAINKKFLSDTNSFEDKTLNADKNVKGFFRDSGRVRAVKFRGTLSEGFLTPASIFFGWAGCTTGIESFLGKEFDTVDIEVNGKVTQVLICEKYVPNQNYIKGPSNMPKKDKSARFDRLIPGQFHFHIDTPNLKKNVSGISPDDIITITEKLHGTSAIFSKILVKRKLNLLARIAKFIGIEVVDKEYDVIYSSRSVIKNRYIYAEDEKLNHWYKLDVWGLACEKVKHALTPGLTIYAEIVGYLPNGGCIQKGYDYGCGPNEFKVYVYRITHIDVDGNVLEYTSKQCVEHCKKYGLNFVPIHFYGEAKNYTEFELIPNTPIGDWFTQVGAWRKDFLSALTEEFLEKPCKMCKSNVPAEGVVVTVEKSVFTPFKLKSQAFLLKETEELDKGEINMETVEASSKVEESKLA